MFGRRLGPVLFLVHRLYDTGDSFPELLDHLLYFSRILIKFFLQSQLDPIDTSFQTGINFILNLLVSFVPGYQNTYC